MCAVAVSASIRESVTQVKLPDNLSEDMWPTLKQYILELNPAADDQTLYMCNYCKSSIRKNKLPPRCVLNGLETVPIPPELSKLDTLSSQLLQRAKCYQTVIRLGTYNTLLRYQSTIHSKLAREQCSFFHCH